MSSETVYWCLTNGGTVYANVPTNKQVGRQFMIRVIENLALHAEESTGVLWVSDRKQETELGEDRRDIRNARELLAAEGWLTDTGETRGRAKAWKLSLPGYTWQAEKDPEHGRANGRANGRASGRDIPPLTEQNINTPLTPQTGQGHRRERDTGGGSFVSDCIDGCVSWEQTHYRGQAGTGLLKTWRNEYRQIITAQVLREQGLDSLDTVVSWATAKRHGKDTAPTTATHTPTPESVYQGQHDCPHCGGIGYGIVRDDQGIATTRKCVCTGGKWTGEEQPPTQLRVVS
jgi:hypothetical protein